MLSCYLHTLYKHAEFKEGRLVTCHIGCVYAMRSCLCRYELQHVVRTHMGACDASYDCVFQREDAAGKVSQLQTGQHMALQSQALSLQGPVPEHA